MIAHLAALLAAGCLGCTQADTTRIVVLDNVTIIDGTGAPARPRMSIVVQGDRIIGIHEYGTRPAPAGAVALDVAGKYVIPGLIDAHVHLASFDRPITLPTGLLRFALLGGVTTVRDMGGQPERLAELVRASRAQAAVSPRVYHSAVFAGPEWFTNYDQPRLAYWSGGRPIGSAPGVRRIDDTTNIEAAVRAAAALGLADSTGTITVGKWADLVVLDADPSADIRNTQTVRMVLRGGVVHERPAGQWELAPGAEGVAH
jgi:adenine deaminase